MVPKRTKIQILNVKTLHKKANDLATRIQITTQGVNSGSSCSYIKIVLCSILDFLVYNVLKIKTYS
jgi:hypothetical protein